MYVQSVNYLYTEYMLYSRKGIDTKKIPWYVTGGNSAAKHSTGPVGRSACRELVNSTEEI